MPLSDAALARAIAYRGASMEERCAMIREYYDRLKAERYARYEARRGVGSVERDHAALLATPLPDQLAVDHPRAWDRFGFWEYGR